MQHRSLAPKSSNKLITASLSANKVAPTKVDQATQTDDTSSIISTQQIPTVVEAKPAPISETPVNKSSSDSADDYVPATSTSDSADDYVPATSTSDSDYEDSGHCSRWYEYNRPRPEASSSDDDSGAYCGSYYRMGHLGY